jgi:hypothetical protein
MDSVAITNEDFWVLFWGVFSNDLLGFSALSIAVNIDSNKEVRRMSGLLDWKATLDFFSDSDKEK